MQRQTSDLSPAVWLAVPLALAGLGYWARSLYLKQKLKKTGIGRGAPGFQTGVKRIAVPPEIAERLRRGETVSPEEIEKALAAAKSSEPSAPVLDSKPRSAASSSAKAARRDAPIIDNRPAAVPEPKNEWLPEHLQQGGQAKKRTGKKRKN